MTWPQRLFLCAIAATLTIWVGAALDIPHVIVILAGFAAGFGIGLLSDRLVEGGDDT